MGIEVNAVPADKPIVDLRRILLPWLTWFSHIRDVLAGLTLSGPSTARPTEMLWIGRPFWDETLQAPVYLASRSPDVWKPAGHLSIQSGTAGPQAEAANLVAEVLSPSQILVTCSEILLRKSTGEAIRLTDISMSAEMPQDLQDAEQVANTWYYLFLVHDDTTRLLLSDSPDGPDFGDSYYGLITAVRTDGSASLILSRTAGSHTDTPLITLVSSGQSVTAAAVSVLPAAPPIGRAIQGWAAVSSVASTLRALEITMDTFRGATRVQDNVASTAAVSGFWRSSYLSNQFFYQVFDSNNRVDIHATGWDF